jgi:gliding motility-associated-like protein
MSSFFNSRIVYSLIILFLVFFKTENAFSQCNLLCNTDFENLQNSPTVIIVDTSFVPCWGTTASDNKIEVWHTGFNGVPSYSGNQFIELNAFFVSTLFQNFTATPGTIITAGFAHRGRAGTDVMSVEIGPIGGPYTLLGTYTDGNTAWGYYTANYTIPTGVGNNFSLRFNSISAAGGNPAIGNFLDAISVNLPSSSTLSFTSTPVSCGGTNDGTAQVLVTGGASPFSYTWFPSGGNLPNATGLSVGVYSVSVTESNGCAKTGTVSVASAGSMSLTVSSQSVSCFGGNDGSAQVSVTGGTAPYSYTWTPTGLNTATITSLSPGVYTVNVSAVNGCAATKTVSVAQGVSLNTTLTSQSVSCLGASDGSVQVTVSGGVAPYSYTWSPSGINTATATSLSPGIYTVNILTTNGCTTSKTVTVGQGNSLNLTATSQSVSCFGASDGSAQVTVIGGTAPFSYTWNPTALNTATINGISSGTYTVNVSSANGCLGTKTISVVQGTPLNITVSSQSVSCLGATDGSVQATVNGGVGPYSFTWSPSGLNTSSLTGLAAGNYTIQSISSNGCSGSQSITVLPGLPLNVSIISKNVSCFGLSDGNAQAIVNNGTAPYTYSWSPLGLTTASVSSLASGSYSVQVTSANGCLGTQTVFINPALQINVSAITQSISCAGSVNGGANVLVTGGVTPYSYTWSPTGINTSTISGLSQGTYTCFISDFNLCTSSVTIAISTVPSPTVSANSSTVCAGSPAILYASGAVSYTWIPGNISAQVFNTSPLITTTYTLIGVNQFGCIDSASTTVLVNPLPTVFAGNDTIVNMDELLTLTGSGSDLYGWIPFGNNTSLFCNYCHEITENPQYNTCYVLEAINSFNCKNWDTVCVTVTQDWNIYIPNAFTPNKNDINDVFFPVGYGISEIELMIFDRWGEMIFKSDDKAKGWDGTYKNTLCKQDVYVYIVNFKTMSYQEEKRIGRVTLLK